MEILNICNLWILQRLQIFKISIDVIRTLKVKVSMRKSDILKRYILIKVKNFLTKYEINVLKYEVKVPLFIFVFLHIQLFQYYYKNRFHYCNIIFKYFKTITIIFNFTIIHLIDDDFNHIAILSKQYFKL